MTETQVQAKNIADLFFNIQDESDCQQVLEALTSVDSETQDLALALITNTLESFVPQQEMILH